MGILTYDLQALIEAGMIQEGDWEAIRTIRDNLLAACDWTMLPDSNQDIAAWKIYRQELRDLPNTYENVLDIVLPDPPEIK